MVSFYVMIALVTWWYPGQEVAVWMLRCTSVLVADKNEEHTETTHSGEGEGGNSTEHEAAVLLAKMALRAIRANMTA
jgi:hypothetical protein